MRSIHVATLTAAALISAASCGSSGRTTGTLAAGTDTGMAAGAGGNGVGGAEMGGAGGVSNACPGQCVPVQPDGWDDADIVWFGDVKDAPSCGQDTIGYEGNGGLVAPLDCGACSCGPPAGSCALPATITANAASCAQNGASTTHTAFDPASGWSGACDTSDPIPSGKLCSGVHCVQSVTVGELGVNETGCTPSPTPTLSPPTWTTFAISCRIDPFLTCPNPYDRCAPAARPGFRVCVYAFGGGDVDCPDVGPYTEKHVAYDAFDDAQSCSACTCSAPSGSACSSDVSLYTDGACSTLASSVTVDATGPACVDVPSGAALGSKSASAPAYAPGACTPGGGVPMGAATPTMASTYCCLPP